MGCTAVLMAFHTNISSAALYDSSREVSLPIKSIAQSLSVGCIYVYGITYMFCTTWWIAFNAPMSLWRSINTRAPDALNTPQNSRCSIHLETGEKDSSQGPSNYVRSVRLRKSSQAIAFQPFLSISFLLNTNMLKLQLLLYTKSPIFVLFSVSLTSTIFS